MNTTLLCQCKNLYQVLFFVFLFSSCSDDEIDDPVVIDVVAAFTSDMESVDEGGSIAFSDQSEGDPTSWQWSFEGGSPSTSQDQNPVVSYNKAGFYNVSLQVSNEGDQDVETKQRLIHVTCTGNYCEASFTEYDKTENIMYGVNDQHQMILYEPQNDTRTDRSVAIFMGGGGFEGTNLDFLEPLAINLTRYGMVVALIEYRVIDTDDGTTELINAQQDSRTAVRYLKSQSTNLGINSNMIFTGGSGSGAFAALYHAYVDESDLEDAVLDVINGLGGLEGSDQGNSALSSEVAGVISLAGGMFATLDPITSSDVPVYAIHGTADTEVPYDTESTSPTTYGSKPVVEKVKSVGLAAQLYSITNGSHTSPRQQSGDYIQDLMYFLREIIEG